MHHSFIHSLVIYLNVEQMATDTGENQSAVPCDYDVIRSD